MKPMVCLAAFFAAGCAHVDLGQVDYRVADPAVPGSGANLTKKYDPTGLPIEKDEYYSIELEQAMVGPDVSEGRLFKNNLGRHAEMAILANVFELDASSGKGFVDIPDYDIKAAEGKPRLKLVYYGDDLEKLQPFNFSNMPLLARAKYGGGRVGIQLVIKEIDGESPAIASLLDTLAGYGKTVSPVPQVTDVLLDLGTSLLQGSKDDRLFDYRLTLSSGAAVLPNGALDPRGSLVAGRYVFMKDKERQTAINWQNLRYDHNTGRLMKIDGAGGEFRDNLYVVLNVARYGRNAGAETIEQPDWAAFREKLPAASADQTVPLTTLTENFAAMVKIDRSDRLKARMLSAWSQVDRAGGLYIARALKDVEQANLSSCLPYRQRLLLERDLMKQRMADGVRGFLEEYRAATATTDATGKSLEPALLASDKEAVVSAIATSFMPWNPAGTSANFASAAAFEAAYLGSNGGTALAAAAQASFNARAPSATCPG
jgi:hypothetical protein